MGQIDDEQHGGLKTEYLLATSDDSETVRVIQPRHPTPIHDDALACRGPTSGGIEHGRSAAAAHGLEHTNPVLALHRADGPVPLQFVHADAANSAPANANPAYPVPASNPIADATAPTAAIDVLNARGPQWYPYLTGA